MSYLSILIEILRFRESELNDLEANEDIDTNYDLTVVELVVEREIYEEECDRQLETYNLFSYKIIRLRVVNYIYIFCANSICQ